MKVRFALSNKADKEGRASILLHCHHGRARFAVATGLKIPSKYWNAPEQFAKRGHHLTPYVNNLLEEARIAFEKEERRLYSLSLPELKEYFRSLFAVTEYKEGSFYSVADQYIRQKEKSGQFREGTIKGKRSLFNLLKEYDPDLSFEKIGPRFLSAFRLWLQEKKNPAMQGWRLRPVPAFENRFEVVRAEAYPEGDPVPLLSDTIDKHFKNLKAFLHWSFDQEYHMNPVYLKVKLSPSVKAENTAINEEELQAVQSHQFRSDLLNLRLFWRFYEKKGLTKAGIKQAIRERFKQIDKIEAVRELFLFQLFTVQRFSDVKRFKKAQLSGQVWEVLQVKTRKKVRVPLLGFSFPAWQILQRRGFVLPSFSDQHFNRELKVLFEVLNMDRPVELIRYSGGKQLIIKRPLFEKVSSHTARRSGATLLLNRGLSVDQLMKLGGWADIRTLNKYLHTDESGLIEGLQKAGQRKAV